MLSTRLPLVSIGLPVRNGAGTLVRALDKLLGQTYSNIEVLISDNASTDATREICLAYSARDPRIEYTRQEQDVGVIANFNDVLSRARGPYFMWAAHDDTWEAVYVSKLIAVLDDSPDAVLAFAGFDNVSKEGKVMRRFEDVHDLGGETDRRERVLNVMRFPEKQGKANLVYGLVRTEVLRGLGGLRVHTVGGWGCDYHLLFELACCGRFVSVCDILFHKTLASEASGEPVSGRELSAYAWMYPKIAWRRTRSPYIVAGASRFAARFAYVANGNQFSLGTGLRARLRSARAALVRR